MKIIVWLLFIYISSSLFAQEYTLTVRKKEKPSDYFPQIDGVMSGDIELSRICNGYITTAKGWVIQSYNCSYGYKHAGEPIHVSGNRIPNNLCNQWSSIYYKELPIFFTDIQAMDEKGRLHQLNNFQLILK